MHKNIDKNLQGINIFVTKKAVRGKIMKDFAAIDFETANSQPQSVCSLGVVLVRGGEIVGRYYSLIRPRPFWFSYWNTRVHGLTAGDVCNAPEFPAVWAQVAPRIEGLTLVAHNCRFDEGCLKAVFEEFGMDYPNYQFLCTLVASRRHFGRQLPNHRLDTVAAHCGHFMTNHHNALADAEACAAIALKIL